MRKINNKKFLNNIAISLFNSVRTSDEKLELENISNILKDIDISSAINKLNRAVSGRKLKILTEDTNLSELSKELQKRFNGIKFNRIINHLISARYFGYSCFEIIYNQNFEIETLIPIPHKNINYKDKKWMLKISTEEIGLTKDKFLLSIHQWNPGSPEGKSILEECNLSFLNKQKFENLLRGLSQQYGKVIPVYLYNEDLKDEEIEVLAKSIENPNGMKSIGIPVSNKVLRESEVKKVIDFIKLSDLDPEIYTKLEEREKKKLIQNILGGTLTIEASSAEGKGTNALGTVHQEGFNEVVEEICSFVSDSLFQLLEIDAMYHGYNAKDFKIVLEKEVSESEIIKKDKTKEELNANKLENLLKLKNIGYTISKKALSDILGVDEKNLEEYEEKGILEFSSLSSKKKINFLKEKVELNNDILDECIGKSIDIFTKNISSQLKNKLLKVKKPIDIEKISLDFNLLKEKLILSYLKGFIDDSELKLNEFSEDDINPFNLKYEKAIQYFLNKKPSLIDDLEEINNKVLEQVFYIKRSTEIETTKKLYSSLLSNMEEGKTFKNWLTGSEEVLNKSGLLNNPYYLEIVYRNNMNSAYNAGAFYNQELNRENKPYGLYDAVGDNRTSPICKSLDEKVYPLDHIFWKNYLPPNHHACRSRRITLSKEEVEDYGFKISKSIPKNIQDLKDKMGNFYGDQLTGLRKLVKAKEKELLKLKALDKNGILKEEGIENLKSKKEFVDYMKNNLSFELVQTTGMDLNVLKEIGIHIENSYKEYPILNGFIRELKLSTGRAAPASAGISLKGNDLKRTLTFNKDLLKNKGAIDKMIKTCVDNKWWTPKNGIGGILRHELGHMLEYSIVLKRHNLDIYGTINHGSENILDAWLDIKKGKFSKEVIKNSFTKNQKENISSTVSKYAATNSKETLAECIGCDSNLEISLKVKKYVKKIISEVI